MSKTANPDYPIHDLIAARWSPYAFSRTSIPPSDLRSVFEAARWAPSSFNEQPWRYLVATRHEPADFERLLSCLMEGNRAWAQEAPVLALGCIREGFSRNDRPNRVALHDLGLASASLTFEAANRGIYVHQMAGIFPEKAKEVCAVPDGFQVVTGLALGYPAPPGSGPLPLQQRDASPRTRRAQDGFVFGARWGTAWGEGRP